MAEPKDIHEIGAERHGDQWLHCNRRAVEILWDSTIRADSPAAKKVIPRIVLMVLDRAKIAAGLEWNAIAKKWVPKPAASPVAGVSAEKNYHFSDEQVRGAMVSTDYLRDSVLVRPSHMTGGEKWSLYRAIVLLAQPSAEGDGWIAARALRTAYCSSWILQITQQETAGRMKWLGPYYRERSSSSCVTQFIRCLPHLWQRKEGVVSRYLTGRCCPITQRRSEEVFL
jgi:hypothetical protein